MNNLIVRTISGTVFLAILVGGIVIHPFTFGALTAGIVAAGMSEYYGIVMPGKFGLRKAAGILTGLCLFAMFFAHGFGVITADHFLLLVVPVTAIFVYELYAESDEPFKMISYVLSGVVYIALPFSLMNVMTLRYGNYDYRLILAFFIFLWANDVGAYCFGMMFGRSGKRKLFERISPKKSWEGFIGGLIAAIAAGYIVSEFWGLRYGLSPPQWILAAGVVSITATFGDLIESLLKRSAGIKDSGNIMPGHGGILDRFDGALTAFPCMLALMKIFL